MHHVPIPRHFRTACRTTAATTFDSPFPLLPFSSSDDPGALTCRAELGPVRYNGPLLQFRSSEYGHFWLKCPQLIRAHTPKQAKNSPQLRAPSRLRSVSSRRRLKITPISGIPQVLPWTLKPPNAPTDWGVRPMWPWTAIPHCERAATSFLRRTPPSSLMASIWPSLITRIQLWMHWEIDSSYSWEAPFGGYVGTKWHVADEKWKFRSSTHAFAK